MSPQHDGDPCTVVTMPFEAASARQARHLMTEELASEYPTETIADAGLVLTELLTNALKHGRPSPLHEVEVGWCLFEDSVRICVSDAGTSTSFGLTRVESDSESGRGLAIVDALSESWGLELAEGRTRVVANIAFA